MTVLPTVRYQLIVAAEHVARTPEGHVFSARVRWRRAALIAAAIGLLLVGVAFGSGLLSFGKAAPTERLFANPRAELGALTPGTVRLLPVSTPDPDGGPPWGLRVLSTTRGVGCIQVGRLLDGKLGALGQDGAFGDDGRFHELPVNSSFDQFSCAALDGKGRIFNNVTQGDLAASAVWFGGPHACVPAGTTAAANPGKAKLCPQGDERNVYYGLLGPEATSITSVLEGKRRTVPTIGADGAYLLVTHAPRHQLFDFPQAGTADVVPVDGPITEIHYRGGATCHLTARSWIGGASACTPSLQMPVGYAPVAKAPTRAEVASPVHVKVVPGRRGRRELEISFISRVAITSGRSQYSLNYHSPHEPPQIYGGISTRADIARGQRVTLHGTSPAGHLIPGLYKGSITLLYATGPALLEGPGTAKVIVGHFTIHVR
jgi:hypothetical protein